MDLLPKKITLKEFQDKSYSFLIADNVEYVDKNGIEITIPTNKNEYKKFLKRKVLCWNISDSGVLEIMLR